MTFDADDREALDQLPELVRRDRADDAVVDRLGVRFGESVLAEQVHVAQDRALLVDIERELLAIRRQAIDPDPALLDDVDPVRRIIGRQDLLAADAMGHGRGMADGLHVRFRQAREQRDFAEETDLLRE